MSEMECNCISCEHNLCAKRVSIFHGLSDEEINQVASLIVRKSFSKGEMIIMEGGKLDSLYIINQGKVKAFRYTPEGKEQILYIFDAGDFFGEKNLFDTQNASYHVEALSQTSICTINNRDFKRLLRDCPDISFKIIDLLCVRISVLESAIQNMGTKNIEKRVNSLLLEFAEKYGREDPRGIIIDLPLSREGMANYIGVTRETISRKMSSLQDEGMIDMIGNKKLIINNIEALRADV